MAPTTNPAERAHRTRAAVDDAFRECLVTAFREFDGGAEALYVAPVDTYQFDADRELLSSDIFPATHPDTAERVERLQELAGDRS